MDYFAGLDVSLEMTSICIVDADGTVMKEAKVASEPDDLVAFFAQSGMAMKRICASPDSITTLDGTMSNWAAHTSCLGYLSTDIKCNTANIALGFSLRSSLGSGLLWLPPVMQEGF